MLSCKLNMTLKQFIIFVFLTLDIGLFVQPYPLEGAWILVANQGIKRSGEEMMHVSTSVKSMVTVSPNDPKMLSDVTQRCMYTTVVLFIVATVKHITLV